MASVPGSEQLLIAHCLGWKSAASTAREPAPSSGSLTPPHLPTTVFRRSPFHLALPRLDKLPQLDGNFWGPLDRTRRWRRLTPDAELAIHPAVGLLLNGGEIGVLVGVGDGGAQRSHLARQAERAVGAPSSRVRVHPVAAAGHSSSRGSGRSRDA